ncbi:MAG TPA: class I SAM-dependent methyltransferase [Thermoanaerobaculia bacterium]|jgi:SAM-dependent methyltransferase|nr:class I SAM-dependent methyltransferase [Thermoanaerobaculia bacterium]
MNPIDPAGSRLLAAFRADVLRGAPLPSTAIHPDDYMLRFFLAHHHGHWEGALVDYFRSGFSAARTFDRLLRWRFGSRAGHLRLLDFASGFGRVTRFLVQHHPPRELWVSDIFAPAVDFQRQQLGVHGFVSATEPAGVCCDETFDAILVSSLFSHLPEESFVPWLRRLLALLRPAGMLLFSVHDRSLRAITGATGGEDGFAFTPVSEIPELGGDSYGTSWVDEAFVCAAVRAAGGGDCRRLPRALWSFQDLYLVGTDELPEPPLFHEPIAYLEGSFRRGDRRSLVLHGWAHDPNGAGVQAIEARLEGELVATVEPTDPRPDVKPFLGASTDAAVGWEVSVPAAAGLLAGELMVSLTVTSRSGNSFFLHLGSVEGTELGLKLRNEAAARASAETRADEARAHEELLAGEVARMRASRFWKLRDAWWSLKGKAGLAR